VKKYYKKMSDTEETEYLSINSSRSNLKNKDKISIISKSEEYVPMKIIEIISDLLNNICEENKDKSENINKNIKPFMTESIPSLSIKDYLIRLSQFTKINESTIILILIYIDRIGKINKFILTYRNIYKLILASMVIAIKYNEDNFYSSEVYAKLGGLSVPELNYLEFQFLIQIKFSLFIEKDLFDKYYYNLLSFQEEEEDSVNIEEDNEDNTEEEDEKTKNNINDDDIVHDGDDD
jgi:hypothetical protein